MTNTPKTTPKDFFLYMGVMAALYISTISILALWFRIIDEIVVDPLAYSDPYSTGISLAIASLIIIFPAFLTLSWLIHNDEHRNPEKRELKIRKWLTFLTLFLAGAIIIIDLIVLLHQFLSGQELTASFVWKVVVVLIVIGAIFTYYLYKIREELSKGAAKMLTAVTALVVIGSIIAGFVIMGSPQEQRTKRLDQERVQDLSNIQWQIVNYWQQKEELPQSLADLRDSISGYTVPADPQTEKPYEYNTLGPLTFELCATFTRASENDEQGFSIPARERALMPSGAGIGDSSWAHPSGRHCFEREIDPELYPPRTN